MSRDKTEGALLAVAGVLALVVGMLLYGPARADHMGEAIPEGGCVICWGGPTGDDPIGYSTSGHCTKGEAGVVEPYAGGCGGPDLTAGRPALEGLAGTVDVIPPDPAAQWILVPSRWLMREARAVPLAGAVATKAPRLVLAQAGGGVACGVHYETDLANATKRFDEAFQGVKNVTIAAEWESGQSNYNCNHMRDVARRLNREGRCLSYYSGDFDLSDSKCRVYRFTYDRYIGPIGDLGRR